MKNVVRKARASIWIRTREPWSTSILGNKLRHEEAQPPYLQNAE